MTYYNQPVIDIIETGAFQRWLSRLRDLPALDRIHARMRRVAQGNFGDTRPAGDGVFEMRISYGPGYRIYFIREGTTVVVLLCGGDNDSQPRDIRHAKRLAADWRAEYA